MCTQRGFHPLMAKQKRSPAPSAAAPQAAPDARPSGLLVFSRFGFFFLALCLFAAGFLAGVLVHQAVNDTRPAAQAVQSAPAAPQQPAQQQAPDRASQARIAELEKAVISNPSDRDAFVELGNLYFDADQAKLSIAAYENALRLKGDDPGVITDLGVMYRRDGQYDKALDCFRRTLAIEPGHPVALFDMGVVYYYDLHDAASARKAWEELVAKTPQAKAPDGTPVSELLKQIK